MIRKMKEAIIVMVLVGLAGITSCQKESGNRALGRVENAQAAVLQKPDNALGWVPEGTKQIQTKDGIYFTPPDGWEYAGYDLQQKPFYAINQTTKKISCTCNTTGTCKPFVAKGPGGSTQGCMGTCTNCTMTQSLAGETGVGYGILSGGYYSKKERPRLLNNGEEAPAVFKALTAKKEFVVELEAFVNRAYDGKEVPQLVKAKDRSITAPKGYSFAGVLIFGRGVLVLLPNEFIRREIGIYGTAKTSCSCTSGSCSLNDKTLIGVGAVWCEGECTTCTLTTDDSKYSVRLYAYKY